VTTVATAKTASREAQTRTRAPAPRRRNTLRGRLIARSLVVASAVLTRLPEGPLVRLAWAWGGVLYRIRPGRRRLVRANLERVCTYLVAQDTATPRTAAAARDARELDRLVRDAFGHWVRSYLENATVRRYARPAELVRVQPDVPALADEAFPVGRRGPTIVVGLHFGAVEIPALWATARGVPITAPMETIADPDLQSYFQRSRSQTGLRVIPLAGAATVVRDTLERGETVALVADRPISGKGVRVDLFGAPARLPAGPAVLALETGAPTWLVATRRAGANYPTRLERLEMPATGTTRERLAGFMAAQARAFERAVADAPEQWWTMFFPIWDDA
jgi:KDO2-lipid IV(A) lauroyltransferase